VSREPANGALPELTAVHPSDQNCGGRNARTSVPPTFVAAVDSVSHGSAVHEWVGPTVPAGKTCPNMGMFAVDLEGVSVAGTIGQVPAGDVVDLVELSRLLVSVADRSLGAASPEVSLSQFRALALLARHGPCTGGGLADHLGQLPSTTTRLCDRLVEAGWITRETNPDNRRTIELGLTRLGRRLVKQVLTARSVELERILARMPAPSRARLARALPDLLAAADGAEAISGAGWAM